MANRFQKLFSLESNQYTNDCPIIIEAGALQKDNETGNIIAQIKMRNLGDLPIASCKVSIRAFENNGDEVEGVSDYSYLDLNAGQGSEFGTKVPVILPNRSSRSFSVDISEIVYSDGTVKKMNNNQWHTIPKQNPIEKVLKDEELVKQYKMEVGGSAELFPEKRDGFFLCTCGAVNFDSADICYKCGNSYEKLCDYINSEYLLQKIDERNEISRKQKEKQEKKKKLYIIIGAAAIAVLVLLGVASSIHQKNETNKDAAICASLAGKSFTAIVDGWGERHCDFDNNGKVHAYSFNNSGENFGDTYYIYEVRKLDDGQYGIDFAFSKESLFHSGNDYIVLEVSGTQITEFRDTDDFAGYDYYRIDY